MALDDEKVLFREDTPGVQAFNVFSRMVGMPYLWNTFALPIAELELANNAQVRNRHGATLAQHAVEAKSGDPCPFRQMASSSPSKSNVTDSDPSPLGSIFSLTTSVEVRVHVRGLCACVPV
jgi:hypothetical protein